MDVEYAHYNEWTQRTILSSLGVPPGLLTGQARGRVLRGHRIDSYEIDGVPVDREELDRLLSSKEQVVDEEPMKYGRVLDI